MTFRHKPPYEFSLTEEVKLEALNILTACNFSCSLIILVYACKYIKTHPHNNLTIFYLSPNSGGGVLTLFFS